LQKDIDTVVSLAAKVQVDRNVLVFTAAYDKELPMYAVQCINSIRLHNISNAMIISFSDQTYANQVPTARVDTKPPCKQREKRRQVGCWRLFYTLELLKAGFNVLQSDLDIVFFSNPFMHLSTQHDVQAMSDAVTREIAFGYTVYNSHANHQSNFGQWEFHVNGLNIGFYYVRSSPQSIYLYTETTTILTATGDWEQYVLSHLTISFTLQGVLNLKVLNPVFFQNSGFMERNAMQEITPIVIHSSHHADKQRWLQRAIEKWGKAPATKPDDLFVYNFSCIHGVHI
jgi:hypothetical protein